MFGGFGQSSPFGQSTNSSFGQQQTTSSPFGQQPATSPFGMSGSPFGQQPTSSSPFGQQPTSSSPFGQQPTSSSPFGQPASSSPFGQQPASSSPFGQQPASSSPFGQQPASSSPFGQQPASSSPFGQQPASSSPFGQSPTSSSPFGQSPTSSAFGQSPLGQSGNAVTSSPFAPKPFGSSAANSFGSQTGGSNFGFAPTGAFGQIPTTTPAFGASSSPAFGSSAPAFGASSTPAFGASSSPFGGSSLFGQKPAFGGFGSSSSQSNPFGSSFPQTQSTFGSSPFGSTTSFGASSQPAFGASSSPAFGATSTPAFGATSTPAFGSTSTPAFGSTSTPAFGATSNPAFGAASTPAFGAASIPAFGAASTPAFGAASTPAFGATSTPAFGATSTPAFGATSTPAFGATSTPAFGATSTPAFGATSTPAFGATSTPTFGATSTPAFGSTTFGSTGTGFGFSSSPAFGSTPAFGSGSSSIFGSSGGQSSTPTFGSTIFGQSTPGQQVGSRVVPFAPTVDTEGATGTQSGAKLESISAMPAYKEKSHEELRWQDYQRGDKGGANPAGLPSTGVGFSAPPQTNPFGQASSFGQTSSSSFPSTSGGLFGSKPAFGTSFGQSTPAFSSPFGASSASAFGSSSTTSLFGVSSAPAFSASSTPLFASSSTPSFGFSSAAAATTPTFNSGLSFGNTQSAGLFQSSPATGQTSLFGQPTSVFGQSQTPASSSLFGGQSTGFGGQSTGFGGSLFGASASPTPSSAPIGLAPFSSPFQPSASAPASSGFSFGNFGQTQSAGFGGASNIFSQSPAPTSASQANIVYQPAPLVNPFGTLPPTPQISIGRSGGSSSYLYGIANMPVSEKPVPVRVSSLVTPRHLSQRRVKLPPRRYSKSNGPRVPFFLDEEEVPTTPKADALFIPRENPRELVIRPIEEWPSRQTTENVLEAVHENVTVRGDMPVSAENGTIPNGDALGSQDGVRHPLPSRSTPKATEVHVDHQADKVVDSSYTTFSGNRAGEAAIAYEHGADIEALMPKLRHPEYYTEPRVQELAAKERATPGFCRHVRDFIVGRHGYGSIKFEGETDVRRLDLETLVQFNHREVIVYKDESKKPPVGQGLNKPGEVTLLNVKLLDKKTGHHFTEGPKIENFCKMLKKKAEEQGARYLSYEPVKGEWKFKVDHF